MRNAVWPACHYNNDPCHYNYAYRNADQMACNSNYQGTIRPKDIDESLAFWKPRKVAKGDFFNMQSMVCNDLGLVVNAGFGWQAFTTDELINYDNGFTWYTTFFHFIVSLLIIAEIITLANEDL